MINGQVKKDANGEVDRQIKKDAKNGEVIGVPHPEEIVKKEYKSVQTLIVNMPTLKAHTVEPFSYHKQYPFDIETRRNLDSIDRNMQINNFIHETIISAQRDGVTTFKLARLLLKVMYDLDFLNAINYDLYNDYKLDENEKVYQKINTYKLKEQLLTKSIPVIMEHKVDNYLNIDNNPLLVYGVELTINEGKETLNGFLLAFAVMNPWLSICAYYSTSPYKLRLTTVIFYFLSLLVNITMYTLFKRNVKTAREECKKYMLRALNLTSIFCQAAGISIWIIIVLYARTDQNKPFNLHYIERYLSQLIILIAQVILSVALMLFNLFAIFENPCFNRRNQSNQPNIGESQSYCSNSQTKVTPI